MDKFFIGSDLMKKSKSKIIKLEEYRSSKIKLELERKELLQLIRKVIETKSGVVLRLIFIYKKIILLRQF